MKSRPDKPIPAYQVLVGPMPTVARVTIALFVAVFRECLGRRQAVAQSVLYTRTVLQIVLALTNAAVTHVLVCVVSTHCALRRIINRNVRVSKDMKEIRMQAAISDQVSVYFITIIVQYV